MELPLNILQLDLEQGPEEQTAQPSAKLPKLPRLRTMVEKRSGKTATIIFADQPLPDDIAQRLAKLLKQRLAIGGSARGGEILLQGNVQAKVEQIIKTLDTRTLFAD